MRNSTTISTIDPPSKMFIIWETKASENAGFSYHQQNLFTEERGHSSLKMEMEWVENFQLISQFKVGRLTDSI